jgi:hypothetical protein
MRHALRICRREIFRVLAMQAILEMERDARILMNAKTPAATIATRTQIAQTPMDPSCAPVATGLTLEMVQTGLAN